MKNRLLYLSFLVAIIFSSCEKDDQYNSTSSVYESYFPVDSGFTRIYQIDSIYWNEFSGIHDTINYQIKEIVAGTFYDLQGRLTNRIERYRQDSTGAWIIWNVNASNVTSTGAETTEENTRYLKLIFPASLGKTWNGNTFNTNEAWDYEYTEVNQPAVIGSLSFDSSLTVLQYDDLGVDLTKRVKSEERYAVKAGLYFKENIYLQYYFPTNTVRDGYIYTETLLSYSHLP